MVAAEHQNRFGGLVFNCGLGVWAVVSETTFTALVWAAGAGATCFYQYLREKTVRSENSAEVRRLNDQLAEVKAELEVAQHLLETHKGVTGDLLSKLATIAGVDSGRFKAAVEVVKAEEAEQKPPDA